MAELVQSVAFGVFRFRATSLLVAVGDCGLLLRLALILFETMDPFQGSVSTYLLCVFSCGTFITYLNSSYPDDGSL